MNDQQSIAVIGIACRFPAANNPQEFWRNQLTRRSAFRPVPLERWDHAPIYVEGRSRDPLTTPCDRVAFLDDPWSFAGPSFNIAPLRAEAMDPQQRLALELSREALQSAGLERREWDRSFAATFLGVSTTDYSHYLNAGMRARQIQAGRYGQPAESLAAAVERVPAVNSYSLPGCLLSMCASNVAQALDMGGPAFSIDAACASSLMAIVQAVQYLRSLPDYAADTSPIALAGGVYMLLSPDSLISFSRIGAVAPHECRPFDKDSAGFLMGEGGGVVALKRLADAQRDGDPIYAVIRGTAWNSDGKGSHPMMPTPRGQTVLLDRGLRESGWELSDFGYLECHGTATRIGDKVELEALGERLHAGGRKLPIGSVKANIGHTMSAAGVAGFLRAVLSLHHRSIAPHANWNEWNPDLAAVADRFEIPLEARAWGDAPLRASVNSFGFGGTNAFVALEGYPQPSAGNGHLAAPTTFWAHADTREQLPQAIQNLRNHLRQGTPLDSLAYSLSLRQRQPWSAALVGSDRQQLLAQLEKLESGLDNPPEQFQIDATGISWGPVKSDEYPSELPLPEVAPVVDVGPRLWSRKTYLPLKKGAESDVEPVRWERTLSLTTHPALNDHRISGRAIMPFALGLELVAQGARLRPPFALHNVRVERSLIVNDAGTQLRGNGLELFEVRPTGRESRVFQASSGPIGVAPLPRPRGTALELPKVADFYRDNTFHGPTFQGVVELLHLDERSAHARLRGSSPKDWSPEDAREQWAIDPVIIDSALQLGLLWSMRHLGKWLLPLGAERVVLLEPFDSEGVTTQIQLDTAAQDRVSANAFFYQRGRLVGWIAGLQAGISQARNQSAQ